MRSDVRVHLERLQARYPALAKCAPDIEGAYEAMETCFIKGGKMLIAGNGGSAADAEHIVGELMKGFKKERRPSDDFVARLVEVDPGLGSALAERLQGAMPAIALDGHFALSTACLNDMGAPLAFAQQVYGYGKMEDIFLGISTSGNSLGVLYAATVARAIGMKVIGMTGSRASELSRLADVCIQAPETETFMVQEMHMAIYHALCLMLEERFYGNGAFERNDGREGQ